jgi:hypothetical protein
MDRFFRYARTRPAPLLATLGYLTITLAFFWPALPFLGTALPGGPVAAIDGWQNVWHLWWAELALRSGANPFFTPLLYHPDGVNLAVHPLNLSNGLLVLPITALFGPLAAYNVALLLAFVLASLGAYLLARETGAGPGAAFVAGLLFSFGPFHATKAYDGQLEWIALQWLPFYVWMLVRTLKQPRLHTAIVAGLLLAIIGYTSLYYLIFMAVLSPLLALLALPSTPPHARIAQLGRLLLVPLVAVPALAPLLINLAAAVRAVTGGASLAPGGSDPELVARSANLLDFWLPSYLHPLWGAAIAQLGPWLHPNIAAWNHALGYTAIALAITAGVAARRHARPWLIVGVVGLLLALGPVLSIGAWQFALPMPYQALMTIPGMEVARRPGHFVVLTLLALVPLTALGMEALHKRYGPPALALAVLLAALELAPPAWTLHRTATHPVFAELAAAEGAVLVLPIANDSSESLTDQIVHGRPLVGGFLARIPPFPFANETPGVRQLWRLTPDGARLADPAGGAPPDVMAAYGIRDIVVRWAQINPAQRAAAEAAVAEALPGLQPSYSDADLSVYRLPPPAPSPLAYVAAGWYPEERDGDRRWRWMGESATIVLVNPTPAPMPITLRLTAEGFAADRPTSLAFNGAPLKQWKVPAQPAATSLTLRLLLPPGSSRLNLSAPSAADPAGRGPISLALTGLAMYGR